MAETLLSIQEYDADGVRTVYEFSFAGGYISRDDVYAISYSTKDEQGNPIDPVTEVYTWISDFTISIEPAIALGKTVRIYRSTPYSAPIVNFSDGSIINELTLDINAKQAVFLAAEARDRVGTQFDAVLLGQILNEAKVSFQEIADIATAETGADVAATNADVITVDASRAAAEAAAANALAYGNSEIRADFITADADSWAADDWVQVLSSDTGTHTAKAGDLGASGGLTPNSGVYQEDATLGLIRKADLESTLAKASELVAVAKAAEAATTLAAFTAPATGIKTGTLALDDTTGKELLGFTTGGDARVNGIELNRAIPDADGFIHLFGDGVRSYFTWDTVTGQVRIGALTPDTIDRLAVALGGASAPGSSGLLTSVSSIALFAPDTGQSLSMGGGLDRVPGINPVLTNNPPPMAYMFNTGTRGAGGGVLSGGTLIDFVPMVEQENNALGAGETQCSGFAHQHYALALARGQRHYVIGRTHGQEGRLLTQINKGSQPYANGVTELTRAIALADDKGMTIECPCIGMTQGEADRSAGTTKATYKSTFVQYVADIQTDWLPLLQAQEGHSGHPAIKVLIHQLAADAGSVGPSDISVAHYELARDASNCILIGPSYIYETQYVASGPGAGADNVHRPPSAYRLMGAYKAKAQDRISNTGSFRPMIPTSVVRSGTTITITCGNAVGDLVIDTTTLIDNPTFPKGFEYSGATITNVAVSGNQIILTLSAAAAGTLRYAYTFVGGVSGHPGSWGNIRDSDNVPCLPDPSRLLWNWLPTLEEIVA